MSESLLSKPLAPGLDQPLEVLTACHGRMMSQLQTLDRLVRWLPEHGADADACRAATNVVRYFDTAAVNHHQDEEDSLFPILFERVSTAGRPRLRKLVDWIHQDHVEMTAAWESLRRQLLAIAAGESAELCADEVANFASRYHSHIDREDNELFPYAAQLLTPADLTALSEQMVARRRLPR
ncbi:hemerythrin domain-containing protein [Denitromonas ohlonensis]|jgi:hemerythrin-like domain-containing protein|uniref:Hemerythrin domain-containing protein n=2 Tax=Denitromonas TaxID=139331 RepID=A0A558EQH4_9RHOO|nr:hemerythrin domain-containing protein [Denitromonas ohlonensis]TVT46444.1 MAG: hemerythrin domain-containing protein [Denitromonas halophila]TVO60422.1 hemerythrin domain-containing protein [Denitromonas ohlonensis]TVO78587.1 hemerythrin domain-containing protein [Denitromonas ohlonensis]TVT66204.1 MAG: hemerythrin domain-containing protein [Denitromonas halophila]TVT75550.1 MAG: hemerythrin domain-containing protein [Denitromonas halophila]